MKTFPLTGAPDEEKDTETAMEQQEKKLCLTAEYETILDESARRAACAALLCKSYAKGAALSLEELQNAGAEIAAVGLKSGRIAVDIASGDGKRMSLLIVSAGAALNWLRVLHKNQRIYGMEVRFLEPSVVQFLPGAMCKQLFMQNPAVQTQFLRELSGVMESIVDAAYRTAFMCLEERLGERLQFYGQLLGTDCLDITHEELALELAVSREAVSRSLGRLAKQGSICMTRRKIELIRLPQTTDHRNGGSQHVGER